MLDISDVDEPAMAPTADCCCRGLAGDVKVRRHSRHTLAGRSDSLVIARSSDMAMVAVDVDDYCEVLESLLVILNRLDSSHVESGDISDARTPAVDTSNCCSTLSFIIALSSSVDNLKLPCSANCTLLAFPRPSLCLLRLYMAAFHLS
jgi:hypothetical protein